MRMKYYFPSINRTEASGHTNGEIENKQNENDNNVDSSEARDSWLTFRQASCFALALSSSPSLSILRLLLIGIVESLDKYFVSTSIEPYTSHRGCVGCEGFFVFVIYFHFSKNMKFNGSPDVTDIFFVLRLMRSKYSSRIGARLKIADDERKYARRPIGNTLVVMICHELCCHIGRVNRLK